jgi:hypothetical protein
VAWVFITSLFGFHGFQRSFELIELVGVVDAFEEAVNESFVSELDLEVIQGVTIEGAGNKKVRVWQPVEVIP